MIKYLLNLLGLVTKEDHENEINQKNREIIDLKKMLKEKDADIYVAVSEVERFQYIVGKQHIAFKRQTSQLKLAENVLETFTVSGRK